MENKYIERRFNADDRWTRENEAIFTEIRLALSRQNATKDSQSGEKYAVE
jgi:hypothetical protein